MVLLSKTLNGKIAQMAGVQPNENVAQSSSPYREVELSDAQKAFQDIVDVVDSCAPQHDLSKQILVADEIFKSKIRDKLLLASKADLNTKFAQMGINSNKLTEKQECELLKIKNQVVEQTNSISNQAKYISTLMDKVDTLNKEVDTLRSENVKLMKRNDELLSQLDGLLR